MGVLCFRQLSRPNSGDEFLTLDELAEAVEELENFASCPGSEKLMLILNDILLEMED